MKWVIAGAVVVAVYGVVCFAKELVWIKSQDQRCKAMGGQGAYFEKHYECWGWKDAASIRLQFNKATDFKARSKVMLFEAVYE